jgi:hypothetical protein
MIACVAIWLQLRVTSEGAPHELTIMAAIEPPAPVVVEAAPIDNVGAAPPAHEENACKRTSRCPQQPELVADVQGAFEVDSAEPPQPSEYIQ